MSKQSAIDWNDTFLSAALEPDLWSDALAAMALETGATHGQLIGLGGVRGVAFNLVTNVNTAFLDDFIEIGGDSAEVNFRIAANNQELRRGSYDGILHEGHYDAAKRDLSSARYVDWCDEVGIPFGCQTNLVVDRLGLIGFATLRSRKDGRSTPDQRRVFEQAASAARLAVRLQERLEGEQVKLLVGALDVICVTAFLIDHRGDLIGCTQSAEELFRAGDVSLRNRSMDASGRPFSMGQAISALTAANGLQHIRCQIDLPPERPPLFLEGFRLPSRPWSMGGLPHAILIANAPRRDRAGVAAFLMALYSLTPAEADIAMRLFDGKSRGKIVADRDVTMETVRGQIKAIYTKVGVANEAGLVRLLSAIMT